MPRAPPGADPGLSRAGSDGGRLWPSGPQGTRARAATGLRRRAACLVSHQGSEPAAPERPSHLLRGPSGHQHIPMGRPADAPPGTHAGWPAPRSGAGFEGNLESDHFPAGRGSRFQPQEGLLPSLPDREQGLPERGCTAHGPQRNEYRAGVQQGPKAEKGSPQKPRLLLSVIFKPRLGAWSLGVH